MHGPVLTYEQLRDESVHPPTEGPPQAAVQADEELQENIPVVPLICYALIYFVYVCFLIAFLLPLLSSAGKLKEKAYPHVYPSKCWGSKGFKGQLVIALPHPVRITHVTMEHKSKLLSYRGNNRSAPKDFTVYQNNNKFVVNAIKLLQGIVNGTKKGKRLGKFTYNRNCETVQTFKIPR
ncbi:hypothetical protein QTP70_008424 [Hemibagrus guttatus]|uniref:SUN domain-containing protein n=1 Tax=Hemibagrus guttatus TaxID=175788 RepID=A0AAE0PWX5_9TELE|nr:hypothetical protein QTP70_008424 [Hemibagrus guttatus]